MALMVKLNILDSVFHSSLQVIFLLSTPSHLIQRPCLAWDTALAHLSASSWWRTSSTTRRRRSAGVAFCYVGVVAPSPRPPLPCWTWSTMSRCLRADFACATATPGLHLLPDEGIPGFCEGHFKPCFRALVLLHQA